jgi:hypothetical protein
MVGMFTINSHLAYVLFDSGVSHSFMSQSFIEKHDISLLAMPFSFKLVLRGDYYVLILGQIQSNWS